MLLLPTQHVTLGKVCHTCSSQHVKQLSAVVHAMRDDVRNAPAKGSFTWRNFEMVGPGFIPAVTVRNLLRDFRKSISSGIQTHEH